MDSSQHQSPRGRKRQRVEEEPSSRQGNNPPTRRSPSASHANAITSAAHATPTEAPVVLGIAIEMPPSVNDSEVNHLLWKLHHTTTSMLPDHVKADSHFRIRFPRQRHLQAPPPLESPSENTVDFTFLFQRNLEPPPALASPVAEAAENIPPSPPRPDLPDLDLHGDLITTPAAPDIQQATDQVYDMLREKSARKNLRNSVRSTSSTQILDVVCDWEFVRGWSEDGTHPDAANRELTATEMIAKKIEIRDTEAAREAAKKLKERDAAGCEPAKKVKDDPESEERVVNQTSNRARPGEERVNGDRERNRDPDRLRRSRSPMTDGAQAARRRAACDTYVPPYQLERVSPNDQDRRRRDRSELDPRSRARSRSPKTGARARAAGDTYIPPNQFERASRNEQDRVNEQIKEPFRRGRASQQSESLSRNEQDRARRYSDFVKKQLGGLGRYPTTQYFLNPDSRPQAAVDHKESKDT